MTRNKIVLMLIMGSSLVAACNGDSDDSVQGFAIREITTASCESNVPKEINDTHFSNDDSSTPMDVSTLQTACNLPGG